MNNFVKRSVSVVGAIVVCLGVMAAPSAFSAEKSTNKAAQVQQIPAKVNINKAGADELSTVLTGVGLKRAEAIVAYREANGKFRSVDQLAEVKGIGEATVEKNRAKLSL